MWHWEKVDENLIAIIENGSERLQLYSEDDEIQKKDERLAQKICELLNANPDPIEPETVPDMREDTLEKEVDRRRY